MIACPKCKKSDMWHNQNTDECEICGFHPCTIECNNCDWKGTFDNLMNDVLAPKPVDR